ncbi:MAG: PH domain-containing protein [Myxococcota bacterium]
MEFDGERLDPRVVWYWRIVAVPRLVLFVAFVLVVGFVLPLRTDARILAIAGSILFLGSHALWSVFTAGLRYRRFRYALSQGVLEVHQGIIFRREKTIPVDRMQHLDVERGPLERLFGLARLVVFTAGGRTATFQLPGLSDEEAVNLRSRILAER